MDEFFTTACAVRPQSLMTGFVIVGRDLVDFGKHSLAKAIQCNWLQLTEQPPVRLVDDTRHEMTCPTGALTLHAAGPQDIGKEVSHRSCYCAPTFRRGLGSWRCCARLTG